MFDRLKEWWGANGITRSFLKGWRTRIFAIGLSLAGVIGTIDPYMVSSVIPFRWQGLTIVAIGLVTYLLREFTTTPPGSEGNTESWWASTAGRNTEAPTDEGTSL